MKRIPAFFTLIGIISPSILLAEKVEFKQPTLLQSLGEPILVTNPGYAAPSWADVNGDGRKDLIVGQFAQGRVQIFDRKADGTLAKGRWFMTGKDIATVPDIW